MNRAKRDRLFADALRDHAGLVARVARSYEADAARCEELRQDIALALWRALPAFRGEASLATFVARIAHNRGIDHMLARQRDPQGAALAEDWPDPLPEPVQRVEIGERQSRLLAAIRTLPLGMRQVVTLALEGFSHQEIASVLDIETNAVDARLSRARRRLRDLLGDPS